jgi:hypothetical protein
MLADLERTYLKDKNSLGDRQKKNLNHRIKNKLKLIDETLGDVRLILENYPNELIKEHISNNTAYSAVATLERVLQILDPWAIGEHEDGEKRAFRVWGSVIPASKPGECTIDSASRKASDEEIKFHEFLKAHLDRLQRYVDPCIPDPVCRDPEYSRELMNRFMQSATRPFSFSSYTDVAGVTEDRWLNYDPVQIAKDQLQWMRWKPRDLKECIKQPPLLKEKRLHVQWETVTPEEFERFMDAAQKQKPLSQEELAEISERIKRIPRSDEESQPK